MFAEVVPFTAGPELTDGIDRHGWAEIGRARYYRDYVLALKPVIIRGAFDHWPARGKWNLHFLRDVHGDLPITIDGNRRKLGEFIDEVLASTADRPAPYLRNHLMDLWPDGASSRNFANARLHTAKLARKRLVSFPYATDIY